MIPLIVLKTGEKASVLKFDGTGAEFTRLRSLGIDVNTELTVVTSQADKKGPMLLLVNGAKYAIDYNLASKIFVLI
ncbi:MAG: FeoA family protein [Treponema phagedenis]|uniref:FeoA domain protein n=1 Tax=Treponema phagedenis TaxID=162 RepID=A0A0B7H1K4_TREPH|nr:FeoA family protein [Treponema phagedenis]CEM63105.1 FeoA domain protein [Treponema phagedenis]